LESYFIFLENLLYKGQPGPGQYEPKPALNDKGYYFNSKFKNSSATSIDPPTSMRFKEFTSKIHTHYYIYSTNLI